MNRILITGGFGTLGTELQKHIKCIAPTRKEFDITDFYAYHKQVYANDYDLVINCAAYTNVTKAEKERKECYGINVQGTVNLLEYWSDTPFVYISTEYAKNPVNYYSETKLAGETAVKALAKNYLIIRTLFKAVPYPYDKAFTDKWTNGDEVTTIAPLVAKKIKDWFKNDLSSQTVNIGTGRKTFYDIAVKSKPNIKKCSINDIKDVVLPTDTS